MPKYELMYIIGAHVSDADIPVAVQDIKKAIESESGIIEKQEEQGRKKLAYPIRHQRTGFYVLTNFSAAADKINGIEAKIRTSQNVVRHLIINMEEALTRMEKDRKAQTRLKLFTRPKLEKHDDKSSRKIEIDLDAEIEKAIGSEENLK